MTFLQFRLSDHGTNSRQNQAILATSSFWYSRGTMSPHIQTTSHIGTSSGFGRYPCKSDIDTIFINS